MSIMKRLPGTQQITWFLDLEQTKQLNLDPPYQRKSVWTLKDMQYFLDTIFRNYPCPAVFIHKDTNDDGKTTYNVVDGKQRLQTILDFAHDKLAIANNFGDDTLNGKRFGELALEQKKSFWDYIIVVDTVDLSDTNLINEVFDRLNRNSKNLNPQELRHAKYNGWFITEAEKETENLLWETIKISTKSKSRRMRDIQVVSELLIVILERKIVGFDQNYITEIYAKYDIPLEFYDDVSIDSYIDEKEQIKKYIQQMIDSENKIIKWSAIANHFYILWSFIVLNREQLPSAEELAKKYVSFMKKVDHITNTESNTPSNDMNENAYKYYENSRGASTDIKQRNARLDALKNSVL